MPSQEADLPEVDKVAKSTISCGNVSDINGH